MYLSNPVTYFFCVISLIWVGVFTEGFGLGLLVLVSLVTFFFYLVNNF